MKIRGFSERWTIITVSLLMIMALGLLARSLTLNSDRSRNLGKLTLDRAMENQRWQLDVLLNTYLHGLKQQAAYLAAIDSAGDTDLINLWLPVLRSRFTLVAIGIADERGDEQMLERADSTWRFSSTIRSIDTTRTSVRQWPIRKSRIPAPVPAPTRPDPRETAWFSQAIENRMDGPVWSEDEGSAGVKLLQVSLIVRNSATDHSYLVIHYAIDMASMVSDLAHSNSDISTLVLSSSDEPFIALDSSLSAQVWATVLKDRKHDRSISDFRKQMGGQEWTGVILPFDLNGTSISTGVMIGAGSISRWSDQGRLALWTILLLMTLLALLLLMVFLQSRGAERRVRKHERRSNLNARHLAKALVEREVLDREVHHRVKNNLQVVSSLLNLQAQRVPGDAARNEFMRGKRRIDSMALVHHKLYRQSDLSAIDLGIFLDDLAKAVAAMFDPESRTVSHSVNTDGIHCDADTSIQLGMIVCELLANCHQHAFPYATGGHIQINVRPAEAGMFMLTVKDNGKGMEALAERGSQLGLEVVEALADQLDGSVRAYMDGGTTVEVTFKPIGRK